jgi:arylsulfatase
VLDFAGIDVRHPPAVAGRSFDPTGRSLRPYLDGRATQVHPADTPFGFELDGARAMVIGRWKAVKVAPPRGSGEWELYDLAHDPGETADLAKRRPAILARLVEQWDRYARANGVITPDKRLIDW